MNIGSEITPVLLTYNEEANIERTLQSLSWAQDIVVVDSLSRDATFSILKKFPRVRIFQRAFDSHEAQWNFALMRTAVKTPWVLALDADYLLSEELVRELRALEPEARIFGYRASFIYRVGGYPLRASVYPAVTILYKRENAVYVQDGHTQRVRIAGDVGDLKGRVYHDDRKSFRTWIEAQKRYMKLEVAKLTGDPRPLNLPDRIRCLRIVAPPAVFVYCLFGKRLILDGVPGIVYSFQRTLAESILSFYLVRRDFQRLKSLLFCMIRRS